MFTTFDRYLLGRLLHTFAVFFVSAYGLYIVIDLFTNVDDFQNQSGSHVDLICRILEYYAYRACEFFEMSGPMLIVIFDAGPSVRVSRLSSSAIRPDPVRRPADTNDEVCTDRDGPLPRCPANTSKLELLDLSLKPTRIFVGRATF